MKGPEVLTNNWRKSSYCAQGEACVHIARSNGAVQLTESGDPSGAIIHTSPATWATLLRTIKEERRG